MGQLSNNIALAIALQDEAGTFPTIDSDADQLRISNAQFQIAGVTIANDEYTGSVVKNGDEVAGKNVTLSFNIYLRPPGGSDVPAADAYIPGRILQAAKFTENRVTAAVPAAPEAIGAGTTTTVTLGASAAATADLYKGLLVSLSDNGSTYAQKLAAIRAYTAGKVATLCELLGSAPAANYQIVKQLAYQAALDDTDPPLIGASYWMGGMRYDLVDLSVSSLKINVPTSTKTQATRPELQVTLTGRLHDYDDDASPDVTAGGTTPLFKDGDFWIANTAVGGTSFAVDMGLRSAAPPNPNQPTGDDADQIVESKAMINLDLQAYLKAEFDVLAMADAQAQHALWAQWGYTAGNTVAIIIPDGRFNYQSPNAGQDFVNSAGDMFVDAFDKRVCISFPY